MTSFSRDLHSLASLYHTFDTDTIIRKSLLLKRLSKKAIPLSASLVTYFEILLFMQAYPASPEEFAFTEREINRVSRLLGKAKKQGNGQLENTGVPFAPITGKFSHHSLRAFLQRADLQVSLVSIGPCPISLNEVLAVTLPSLERSETTAGLNDFELLDALKIPAAHRLSFLVNELSKLEETPALKDLLFDQLDIMVTIRSRNAGFSKAYNRIPAAKIFYHSSILKHLPDNKILHEPVPAALRLTKNQLKQAVLVVKDTMTLTARETDPTTYLLESSFRLFFLDRGISVAIYDLVPDRQLPLESYVGYTAFKNGLPTAYGGAWIFGDRAQFGINIFETFRGGESAYVMMQLLRVYRQLFSVNYFEIEPFQFGRDNPDGIASGAYWFYYRMGFRSLDPKLRLLASAEWEKITTKKGYRTSASKLKAFTASSLGLHLGTVHSPEISDITTRVSQMIHKKFNNNRKAATARCIDKFLARTQPHFQTQPHERKVLEEVALWAESTGVTDLHGISLLTEMIRSKPVDVFAYQSQLRKFFSRNNQAVHVL